MKITTFSKVTEMFLESFQFTLKSINEYLISKVICKLTEMLATNTILGTYSNISLKMVLLLLLIEHK